MFHSLGQWHFLWNQVIISLLADMKKLIPSDRHVSSLNKTNSELENKHDMPPECMCPSVKVNAIFRVVETLFKGGHHFPAQTWSSKLLLNTLYSFINQSKNLKRKQNSNMTDDLICYDAALYRESVGGRVSAKTTAFGKQSKKYRTDVKTCIFKINLWKKKLNKRKLINVFSFLSRKRVTLSGKTLPLHPVYIF